MTNAPKLRDISLITRTTTVTQEIQAMSAVVDALEKLDHLARTRVATWLFDRYAAPELAQEDGGASRRQIKAEALREAAGAAPMFMGDHEFRDWLRDEANKLVAAIQKREGS